MTVLSKFKTLFKGSLPPDAQKVYNELWVADVPVSDALCRSCPDPCDRDHDDYSRKISIDLDSDMLGSVKPYRRQVLISSGKSDWPHEVTEVKGSLAAFLSSANEKLQSSKTKNGNEDVKNKAQLPSGLFVQNEESRLSILNGSHKSFSDDDTHETVIILPDFRVVADVPRSPEGAETLWTIALNPSYGRSGPTPRSDLLRSWVLPYSCVILLCSHKRRDKRCAVVAPVLEKTFTQYLEHEGWTVHTELEDLSAEPTLESTVISGAELETVFEAQLKTIAEEKKALILRNSHIGGHKFAGNVIIYSPQGTSVWYGRVTSHDVESIVKNTIIEGRVLPAILRGGMNLARPGRKALLDW